MKAINRLAAPTLPALQALARLMSKPETSVELQRLARLTTVLGTPGFAHVRAVYLWHDLPLLFSRMQAHGCEHVGAVLAPGCKSTPGNVREDLARVQSGLIKLLCKPDEHTLLVKHCPFIESLLNIPAFGWGAYEQLLNGAQVSCFAKRSIHRFEVSNNSIAALFMVNNGHLHEHARKSMPLPQECLTLQTELLAMDALGQNAMAWFDQCYQKMHQQRKEQRQSNVQAPANPYGSTDAFHL